MDFDTARRASLLKSAEGDTLAQWLEERCRASEAEISPVPLNELRQWGFHCADGNLVFRHESGRFFSVVGRRIETNFGSRKQWDQAAVLQPEHGLLGMAARINDGVLELLVQAKMEPGCINKVQASPTIQATQSNYSRVHRGKLPTYFEFFSNFSPHRTWLFRSLQVEQTTRFLGKKNFNAFRLVNDAPLESEEFRWCTLRNLKELYLIDNGINMNARSILACLPPLSPSGEVPTAKDIFPNSPPAGELLARLYASLRGNVAANLKHIGETMVWLNEMRARYWIKSLPQSLDALDGWTVEDNEIKSDFFSIMGVRVKANREVAEWDQPLMAQPENGLSVLVGKAIEGVPHFLFQAKCDAGGDPPVHLAPTVSCSVPALRQRIGEAPPFLDYVQSLPPEAFIFNTALSEEGGRFQKCVNHYKILWMEDSNENFREKDVPENYRWIPYETVFELIRHGCLNIESRSLFGFLV
ncbi:MAG: hypothetical protein B0D92_03670 [Spirochaeta sp. LUC14_002_19_P3]|nr:MAG: hypothetical protein B0D92_03670 [Spirochaeta sp. LUC14_002_19_P3]